MWEISYLPSDVGPLCFCGGSCSFSGVLSFLSLSSDLCALSLGCRCGWGGGWDAGAGVGRLAGAGAGAGPGIATVTGAGDGARVVCASTGALTTGLSSVTFSTFSTGGVFVLTCLLCVFLLVSTKDWTIVSLLWVGFVFIIILGTITGLSDIADTTGVSLGSTTASVPKLLLSFIFTNSDFITLLLWMELIELIALWGWLLLMEDTGNSTFLIP